MTVAADGREDAAPPMPASAMAWQVNGSLVDAALAGVDDATLLVTLGAALGAAGLDVRAIEVACDVVDADEARRCIRWRRDEDRTDGVVQAIELFRGMLREGVAERRPTAGRVPGDAANQEGATDWIAIAGHLAPDVTLGVFDDVMTLFVTDREGGFTEADVEVLRHVMPTFTLAMGARLNAAAARALLQTYLGQGAATALLEGRVGLGEVAAIRAVVLYCDLLGFTSMTERLDAHALIRQLNRFFETMTGPVTRAGGQVAGHVGDAVVMYFSVPDARDEQPVCARAVEAALAGLRALDAWNRRSSGSVPPLRARVGIDVGAVVHGNVGSAGRFSFTIIGTPVNRAARLQALAKDLDAVMLMTGDVAKAAGVPCRAFGRHVLKGLDEPVEIMGLSSAD